jgi:hypothetical protein
MVGVKKKSHIQNKLMNPIYYGDGISNFKRKNWKKTPENMTEIKPRPLVWEVRSLGTGPHASHCQ